MAHVEIVRNKALLRNLMGAGREIAGKALDPGSEGAAVLSEAEGLVFALGGKRSPSSLVPMSKAVADTMAELAKVKGRVLLGHSTGFAELDRVTGGLQGGQLITIGARPAMGKTAFALQMAAHIAESTGLCVPFFSYEMSTMELTMRILSSSMKYSLHRLRQGDIPNDFQHDMVRVAERVSAWPLMLDDTPPESVSGMRSVMRRLARRENVGAVFIDYLQLMESDRGGRDMNRTNEITDISRKLKRLASELNVPVIALSQLSRQLESRPNKKPMLSDLRESGSIEQDSSVVLFIYRDHVYNADADQRFGECIVAKQRNGPGGPNVVVPLRWDGECASFSDVARVDMVAAAMDSRAGF
jgi:replicative DNA helicase